MDLNTKKKYALAYISWFVNCADCADYPLRVRLCSDPFFDANDPISILLYNVLEANALDVSRIIAGQFSKLGPCNGMRITEALAPFFKRNGFGNNKEGMIKLMEDLANPKSADYYIPRYRTEVVLCVEGKM